MRLPLLSCLVLPLMVASAHAGPVPPLDGEDLASECSAECLGWSASERALVCLDGGESLACNDCAVAFVKAGDKISWTPLVACGQMEPKTWPRQLEAANARLKRGKYQPVAPLWIAEDVAVDGAPPRGALPNALSVGRAGDQLTLERAGKVVSATRWHYDPDPKPELHDFTSVAVYQLDKTHVLAVFDYYNDGFIVHDRRHAPLPLAAAPAADKPLAPKAGAYAACPEGSDCPSDYDRSWPYLDAFCRGALTAGDLRSLDRLAVQGEVGVRDLLLLFNAHGALYGYRFKRVTWLNDFFYGAKAARWLPPACAKVIGSYASAKAVPAAFTKARGGLKKVWRRHK